MAKTPLETSSVGLTDEGKSFAKEGSAEARVHAAIPEGGILQSELNAKLGPIAKMGTSKAMAAQFIRVEKTSEGTVVHRSQPEIRDAVAEQLRALASGTELPPGEVEALKKRKLVALTVVKSMKLTPDAAYAEWGSGKQVRAARASAAARHARSPARRMRLTQSARPRPRHSSSLPAARAAPLAARRRRPT